MSERVLTLVSTKDMHVFPQNTVAEFRNRVALGLDPDKKYEAALHSITWTRSWYNFLRQETYEISYRNTGGQRRQFTIKPGYYDMETFTRTVTNRDVDAYGRYTRTNADVVLSFDKATHKFRLVFGAYETERKAGAEYYNQVTLSPDLARKCGFGTRTSFEWTEAPALQTFESEEGVNFDPVTLAVLQTDLIGPHHAIGDGLYPVLAFVPSTASYGQREVYTPVEKLWFPLASTHVQDVRVYISTTSGDVLAFEYGTLVLTVVLREK